MYKSIYALLITGILLLSACKKEEAPQITSAEENALSFYYYNNVTQNVLAAYYSEIYKITNKAGTPANEENDNCPIIFFTPADADTWPKTLTINYGTDDCQGEDGFVRSGMLTCEVSKDFSEDEAEMKISFFDFKLNDNTIAGDLYIINKSVGNYSVSLKNGIITTKTQKNISREAELQYTQITGTKTITDNADDKFSISGTAMGMNSEGEAFKSTITTSLFVDFNCKYAGRGASEIQTENESTMTIDYGNGSCDNEATVIVDGKDYNITIKE